MSFNNYASIPLTAKEIHRISPLAEGVYGIKNRHYWIYIGTGNLRLELLDQLQMLEAAKRRTGPIFFVAEEHDNPLERQQELIEQLRPICNEPVTVRRPGRREHSGRCMTMALNV